MPRSVVAAYQKRDPGGSPDDVWWSILSDRIFGLPTSTFIAARRGRRADVELLVRVEVSCQGRVLRVAHTFEIPYVFDTFDAPGVEDVMGTATPGMRLLSTTMQDAWVRFAADGDPATSSLADWKPCGADPTVTMLFDLDSRIGPDPRPVRPRAVAEAGPGAGRAGSGGELPAARGPPRLDGHTRSRVAACPATGVMPRSATDLRRLAVAA